MMRRSIAFARSFAGFAGFRALTAFAFVLAGAALEGIGILLLIPVLDLVIGQSAPSASGLLQRAAMWLGLEQKTDQIVFALAGFLTLLALRGWMIWSRDIRLMQLSLGFVDHWRTKLFRALTAAPWSTSARLARARIEHAILDDVARMSAGTDRILRGFASLSMLIAQGCIAAMLSPVLTALVLGFVIVAGLMSAPLIMSAQRLGGGLTRSGQTMFELVGHFLAGLKLAKAHRAEVQFAQRFDRTVTEVRRQIISFSSRQTMMRVVFQFFAGVIASMVILVGVLVLRTPITVLVVFTLILARLAGPLLSCLQNLQQFANMLPAFDNVERLLADLERSDRGLALVSDAASSPAVIHGAPTLFETFDKPVTIELSRVSFRHAGQTEPTLTNISLKIEPGEFVGLAGASGSGKTTLADIIAGLIEPQSGRVTAGGHRLDDGAVRAAWQRRLAYVPQEPFLFDTSIRDNLSWGRDSASDKALWQALEAAAVDDVVRALPEGLASRVGERGQALSGGQRQRLCLARALMRRPSLIILDEATNALDVATEAALLERLDAQSWPMTVIMIAHRVDALARANRVFEVTGGHLRPQEIAARDEAIDVPPTPISNSVAVL